MAVLPIRHVASSNPPRFQLQRPDGRTLPEVEVPSPVSFPVEGRPTSGLVRELAWYLATRFERALPGSLLEVRILG